MSRAVVRAIFLEHGEADYIAATCPICPVCGGFVPLTGVQIKGMCSCDPIDLDELIKDLKFTPGI